MSEHKIEILCQMEDERGSPVEHCNAGPEVNIQTHTPVPDWIFQGQQNMPGTGWGGLLGGLGTLGAGVFGGYYNRCPHCGK